MNRSFSQLFPEQVVTNSRRASRRRPVLLISPGNIEAVTEAPTVAPILAIPSQHASALALQARPTLQRDNPWAYISPAEVRPAVRTVAS